MKHRVHSFSAITLYRQCAFRYGETKIHKRYPYTQSAEAAHGEYVHKCIENAITLEEPLPQDVSEYQPLVNAVGERQRKGWSVESELTFVIRNDDTACFTSGFDTWVNDNHVLAGNIDLLMTSPDNTEAVIVDWKTNKSSKYANREQLDLYALGVLLAIPTLQSVEGCLLFLCADYAMVRATYTRADIPRLRNKWHAYTVEINQAIADNNFPIAEPTPLCGWCECTECPNWQQGQDFRNRRSRK